MRPPEGPLGRRLAKSMAWDKQVRADKIRLAALKQTTNFVFMVQKSIADFDFFECKKPYKQG